MNPTKYLGEEERLGRIAELLSKGVTLMLIREAEAKRLQSRTSVTSETPSLPLDVAVSGNEAIMEYISRIGSASPKQVQSNLGLTRSSACRRLGELESRGLIVRTGQTRAVRYELAPGLTEANEAKSASG